MNAAYTTAHDGGCYSLWAARMAHWEHGVERQGVQAGLPVDCAFPKLTPKGALLPSFFASFKEFAARLTAWTCTHAACVQ